MGCYISNLRKKRNIAHLPGPLDGSLYAKVNKSKRAEHENHVIEATGDQYFDTVGSFDELSTNQQSKKDPSTNQKNSNFVVLNGNKLVYRPQTENTNKPSGIAPLASLSEFNNLSNTSSSVTSPTFSLSSVTRVELSENFSETIVFHRKLENLPQFPPEIKEIRVKTENMEEGSIQKTAKKLVSDVITNSHEVLVTSEGDVINFRDSTLSSCSATTLSSTETDDGEEHVELSDQETVSNISSYNEDTLDDITDNLSPVSVKERISALVGSISPPEGPPKPPKTLGGTILSEETATFSGTVQKRTPVHTPEGSKEPTSLSFNKSSSNKPVATAESPLGGTVPVHKVEGVMYNGGVAHGNYEKGPDYAVPMRDMKIVTIPSKRAVLVSAGSDDGIGHETMTSKNDNPDDRRDSVYDEGNLSYSGAGYATIEECSTNNNSDQKNSHLQSRDLESDISHLPEDVQALLNGLQDNGPMSSDIDSGFHGSAMGLSHNKGSHDHVNMTSQTSPEVADPYQVQGHYNSQTPIYDGKSYFTEKVIPREAAEVQHAQITDVKTMAQNYYVQHMTESKREDPTMDQGAQPQKQPHNQGSKGKVHKPSVTMSTQTLPEPQEAKVEIITIKNVYNRNLSDIPQPSRAAVANQHLMTSPVTIATETPAEVAVETEQPIATEEEAYFDDVEDEMESESMMNVEEQIRHTQQHLMFLQEQQEKMIKRKHDRSRLKENTNRNSSAFEKHSHGYQFSTMASSTLPRQPMKNSEVRLNGNMTLQQPKRNMPPVADVNQTRVGGAQVQQNQSNDPWQSHGRSLGRQVSDTSHDRQRPVKLTKANTVDAEPRKENNNDIIMDSSDLQEQLAELDRCIAQLTNSMDIPDVPASSPAPPVVHRHQSVTDERSDRERNVPVPRPPARSRSSFDSYKRLSQEFDISIKRRSITDAEGADEVFSPAAMQTPRPKLSPFPPQTSVTRRQHAAPEPPPKRRMSLEERLSPSLLQTLVLNPGAKPKENIHSYKEDLDPDQPPTTPSFPITPTTPYVNNTSPVRTKSPVGLMKTPLSMLHLKPTDSPKQDLHHHGDEKGQPPNGQAMQNGHVKETALLSDVGARRVERLEARGPVPHQAQQVQQVSNGHNDHFNHGPPALPHRVLHTNNVPGPSHIVQPVHMSTPQQHAAPLQSPTTLQMLPQYQQPQYQHNHSGTSHSSHSPAATSSNSRHGSSDSLDGPSTRHSNSSLLSSSSSASSPHQASLPLASPNNMMRPGSQMSSYDRNFHMGVPGTRSGDESLGSPQSGRTSSSSISDVDRLNHEMLHASVSAAPKFIRDTTSYWYKPDITRDQALALLRNKQAGSFVVRDSRCFPGAYGLALKVDKLPPSVQAKPGVDVANEYVRHFLIEPSSRGVKLKGCPNEPVFGSLSALVYQHSITPLALPCKLIIPTSDQDIETPSTSKRNSQQEVAANSAAELLRQGAACNVVYIGSVDTESLTGPQAIDRAIRETYRIAQQNLNKTSIVHFKVSPQGITLTDNARKIFFRRHYPTSSVTYCGLDSMGNLSKGVKQRRWDASATRGSPDAWMFGFVARKQPGSSDNTCHVFAELDTSQPARAIVNFVTKILIGTARQNQP